MSWLLICSMLTDKLTNRFEKKQAKSVKKEFTIIVADRNHHVREFLHRELASEGYIVRSAENYRQILRLAFYPDAISLLVLDPNLPDSDESETLEKLERLGGRIPIIIHTFQSDYNERRNILPGAAFVEKNGNSIEKLKHVIEEIAREKFQNLPY